MSIFAKAAELSELVSDCRDVLAHEATRDLLSEAPDVSPKAVDPAAFPLKVAFVGQYSSGKTTLVNALAGTNFPTGAGIVTDKVQEEEWHGVFLVDTPGVQTGTREHHDERARNAYLTSDLLVFVTTSAMLDQAGHDLLHRLVGEYRKARQMVFVVNKVGQDTASRDVLLDEARNAVAPHPLDVVLCDALDFLRGKDEKDPELREELIRHSGIDALEDVLADVADRDGVFGRLARPAQRALPALTDAVGRLDGVRVEHDEAVKDLRLATTALDQAMEMFASGKERILESTRNRIQELADRPCDLLSGNRSQEDVSRLAQEINEADEQVESIFTEEAQKLQELVDQVNAQLTASYEQISIDPISLDGQPRVRPTTGQGALDSFLDDVANGLLGRVRSGNMQVGGIGVELPTGSRPGQPLHGLVHQAKRRMHGSNIKPWSVRRSAEKIEGLTEFLNKALRSDWTRAGAQVLLDAAVTALVQQVSAKLAQRQATALRASFTDAADVLVEQLDEAAQPLAASLDDQRTGLAREIRSREQAIADIDGRQARIEDLTLRLETYLESVG